MIKKITPRISGSASDWLAATFRSRQGGAEYVIDACAVLYKRALAEIRELRFEARELALLIDMSNASVLTAGLAGQHLELSAADSMSLDGTDAKWGVSPEALLGKIRFLTSFQRAALEIWCRAFWESGAHETPDGLTAWTAQLANDPLDLS